MRFLLAALFLFILSLLFQFIAALLQPSPVSCGPPQCTLPPARHGPVAAPKRYTSSRYGFSLNYSTTNIKPSQTTDSSIVWQGQLSDGSQLSWSVSGTPANGRSPQQIVQSTQSANFADAQQDYVIPGASLGYNRGYGAVYDVTVSPGDGSSEHDRLLVYAVTRNGLAVVMTGLGPYQHSSPSNSSQPNPAETPLVELGDFEENINTVTWPGQKGF
jgi:hypothetical protein